MLLSINIQIYYFLSTIAAGIIIGLLFDTYRIIIRLRSASKLICAICDMLFCIISAVIIFIFFLLTNNGNVGYYTFVGIPLGLFLYFMILSKSCSGILKWIIYFTGKFIRLLMFLIFLPIRIIAYFLRNLIYNIKKPVFNNIYIKLANFNKIKKKENRNI